MVKLSLFIVAILKDCTEDIAFTPEIETVQSASMPTDCISEKLISGIERLDRGVEPQTSRLAVSYPTAEPPKQAVTRQHIVPDS